MALLDHFHPPLSRRRHWQAFHNAWATYIASSLNELLPSGFFAEPNVQLGIEIDVATFEEPLSRAATKRDDAPHGEARGWISPAPVQTLPFACESDVVEVTVFDQREGPVLAGAIELVSPGNKDRQEQRDALVAKCESYLRQGVGLVMVDIVTNRRADFHALLLDRIKGGAAGQSAELYASAYRPAGRNGNTLLEVWHEPLEIGGELPTMPLHLRTSNGDIPRAYPVDLRATYERTCREQRVQID